ncbi:MAG: hypothetical protein JW726_10185, partial [Anaerolineales bacterium]|nr:hypothetical protein [Anaerolineales bacterium]
LICLVGIVEVFSKRDLVGGVLNVGITFLIVAIFIIANSAVKKLTYPRPIGAILDGALVGATSGAVLALFILITSTINLRFMLVNISPELLSILSFGQPPVIGAVLITLFGAVIGAIAASITLLTPKLQRTITMTAALLILIGLLAELLRVIMDGWGFVGDIFSWLFSGRGLSIIGAIVLAAVIGAWQYFLADRPGAKSTSRLGARPRSPKEWARLAVIAAVLMVLPLLFGVYISEVLDNVGIYLLMGLGLNIVVGYAGLLDLGYVAFYAIGAYTAGVLTSPEISANPMSFWAAVPIAVLVATLAGATLGIPVLKMRGDYLAIVTLGFGEIIRILTLSDLMKPYIGGSQGIQLIAKPTIGSFVLGDQRSIYYVILGGVLLALFIGIRLRDSRMGRTWMAMREDEDVAQAMGINLVVTKLLAFATGAAFSGLAGAIFAAKLASAYPQSFSVWVSFNVICLIIIGGIGSIPGVIVGAFALIGLPELLREFAEYRLWVYGALLVFMMLNRPEGLLPEEAHKRELRGESEAPPSPQATE